MRYSQERRESSDLGQRVLYVLLGAACVVLCYLAGAYWLGPWLHQRQVQQDAGTPSTAAMSGSTVSPATPSSPQAFSPPASVRLEGVQIRERDPSALPDTVRVIAPGSPAPPDESTPTEEPAPPATLEEQPSAPPPPANLWEAPAPAPSRPAEETAPEPGVQIPQTLDGEPAPSGSVPASPPADALYRVRLPNTYESREEADATLRTVTEKGLPAAVVTDTVNGRKVFRVQLGVYRNRANAEKLAEQARRSGLQAEVTTPLR
ncbi:MAG: SPOR domain-containing protein [Armatimonadota bacterium]|nr:SPOR domain-containing protein [Armatimonadota bacterium]